MPRTPSIDLLRGFIMILMALDHASAMIARVHFTEIWGWSLTPYPSFAWWATRFVSHLCAPGFFFLMGMSMYLFAQKRSQQNWSKNAIRNYFLKRGAFILLMMFFLEFPAWGLSEYLATGAGTVGGNPFPGFTPNGFMLPTTVLYGLGMGMILGSFIWRLPKTLLLAITIGSFALSSWYVSSLSPDEVIHPLAILFLAPGKSAVFMSLYPVIPWLGVVSFGLFWAKLLEEQPALIYRRSLYTGLAFILVFIIIRCFGWGNFQARNFQDWISFFTLIKYPPGFVFFFFTLGSNLILFYLFSRIQERKILNPVKLFGQTAMFFYLLHLHLYAWMGAAFPAGCSISIMYLFWAIGLVILYFACRRFLKFKQAKPLESWWRML